MKVTIRLLEPILGTVPKDKEVYASYIESKRPKDTNGEFTNGGAESEVDTITELEEKGWTGFHEDEGGLFIYNYMIKGFLKNAGNILKDTVKVKNLKSKLNNFVWVTPRRIHFGQMKSDGVLERPLQGITAQGPRTSLARSEQIDAGKELTFEIEIYPAHGEISEKLIKTLLGYGKYQGLGQWRNACYGSFEVVSAE